MAHNPFETIEHRLIRLEELILDIRYSNVESEGSGSKGGFMDINSLRDYLPNNPSKPTIYRWVHQRSIPYFKKGRSLYFEKEAIDNWLRLGAQETLDQIKDRSLRTMNGASRSLKTA